MELEDLGEFEQSEDVRLGRQPWQLEFEIGPAPSHGALEQEWRALLARSDASFFLSWPWIETWLARHAGVARLARIVRDGQTVALALLGERKRGFGPLAIRSLHLHATGDDDADRVAVEYNDVLAARGFEVAARVTLPSCFRKAGGFRNRTPFRERSWYTCSMLST